MDDVIHQCHQVDISIVSAINGGLSTPIVRKAKEKSVQAIVAETKTLAAQHQLKMNDITGGAFSLSNLSMYGVDQFDAMINPPRCAILAIGGAKPQVVVEEVITTVAVLRVNLSLDFRVADSAGSSQFQTVMHNLLQNPDLMIARL